MPNSPYSRTIVGPPPVFTPERKWMVRVTKGKKDQSRPVFAEGMVQGSNCLMFGPVVYKQSKADDNLYIKTVPSPTRTFNLAHVTEWSEDLTYMPAPPPAPAPAPPPPPAAPQPPPAYPAPPQPLNYTQSILQTDCMTGDLKKLEKLLDQKGDLNSPYEVTLDDIAARLIAMGWRR